MSTRDTERTSSRLTRWVAPGVGIGIGLAYLAAGWISGDLGFGVFGLALMVAVVAGMLVAARWSETVAGLLDRRDERINQLDSGASLVAGITVLVTVIVMFVVEVAQGQDGSPYYQLGALGGVAYVAALVYLRFRR
jgi:hypothetical protein